MCGRNSVVIGTCLIIFLLIIGAYIWAGVQEAEIQHLKTKLNANQDPGLASVRAASAGAAANQNRNIAEAANKAELTQKPLAAAAGVPKPRPASGNTLRERLQKLSKKT